MSSRKSAESPLAKTARNFVEKLRLAGGKGVPESGLLGAKPTEVKRHALEQLEREGQLFRKAGHKVVFCFAPGQAPIPAVEALHDAVKKGGPVLWKGADLQKALLKLKHYTSSEAAAAVRILCEGSQIRAFKDGKGTKYLFEATRATQAEGYFVSEAARLIYGLVELDGENQQRALGLSPAHYRDGELARQWRNGIAMAIHPDKCAHPRAHAASDELDRLYRRMTG